MNKVTLYVILGLVILIVLVGIILIFTLKPRTIITPLPSGSAELLDNLIHRSYWSDSTSVTGTKGQCHFYDTPIINNLLLASKQPLTLTSTCLDPDLIYAKQVSHVCNTVVDKGTDYPCYKQDGTLAKLGEKEIYFTACKLDPCKDSPEYVSFIDLAGVKCLTMPAMKSDGSGRTAGAVTVSNCSSSSTISKNQLFRIDRADFTGKTATAGNLIRLKDRITGLCVTKNFSLQKCTNNYDFIYYNGDPVVPGKVDNCVQTSHNCVGGDATCNLGPNVIPQLMINPITLGTNPFLQADKKTPVADPKCVISKFFSVAATSSDIALPETSLTTKHYLSSCAYSNSTPAASNPFPEANDAVTYKHLCNRQSIVFIPSQVLYLVQQAKSTPTSP
jgi:hypothetical protein